LSELTGTYAGYIDFDGVRYWDFRAIQPPQLEFPVVLPSDSEVRKDLNTLRSGDITTA